MAGKEIEFDIEPTDTVKRIKERVEEKEGIPPPQQVRRFKPPAAGCRDNVSGGSPCSLLFCWGVRVRQLPLCSSAGELPSIQALYTPAEREGLFLHFACCSSCQKARVEGAFVARVSSGRLEPQFRQGGWIRRARCRPSKRICVHFV